MAVATDAGKTPSGGLVPSLAVKSISTSLLGRVQHGALLPVPTVGRERSRPVVGLHCVLYVARDAGQAKSAGENFADRAPPAGVHRSGRLCILRQRRRRHSVANPARTSREMAGRADGTPRDRWMDGNGALWPARHPIARRRGTYRSSAGVAPSPSLQTLGYTSPADMMALLLLSD